MNSLFYQAQFILGAASQEQFPDDRGAEIAFAGRSNAGKSSVINVVTNQNKLARTSKTPGRTQQINFFGVNDDVRLVDLPGYGFAKASNRARREWGELICQYLEGRQSLIKVVIIMDSRHPLKESDGQMLGQCMELGIPSYVLLTKADKLSRGAASKVLLQTIKAMKGLYQNAPEVQLFSALKKTGLNELQENMHAWISKPEEVTPKK